MTLNVTLKKIIFVHIDLVPTSRRDNVEIELVIFIVQFIGIGLVPPL